MGGAASIEMGVLLAMDNLGTCVSCGSQSFSSLCPRCRIVLDNRHIEIHDGQTGQGNEGHILSQLEGHARLLTAAWALRLIEAQLQEELLALHASPLSAEEAAMVPKRTAEELLRPVRTITEDDTALAEDQCAVCMCDFEASAMQKCVQLPCLHCFHRECLSEWLNKSPSCPTCRLSLDSVPALAELQRLPRAELERRLSYYACPSDPSTPTAELSVALHARMIEVLQAPV